MLECRVTLEKCDKPGSGGTVVGGGKRSKAQSKAPASHSRGKLRSTVTIDKQKFYSIPVDQLTRPPLRSRIRRHISARNHHRLCKTVFVQSWFVTRLFLLIIYLLWRIKIGSFSLRLNSNLCYMYLCVYVYFCCRSDSLSVCLSETQSHPTTWHLSTTLGMVITRWY